MARRNSAPHARSKSDIVNALIRAANGAYVNFLPVNSSVFNTKGNEGTAAQKTTNVFDVHFQ